MCQAYFAGFRNVSAVNVESMSSSSSIVIRAIGTDPVQILRELDQGAGDGINPGKS